MVPAAIVLGSLASFLLVMQPNLDGGCGQRTVRPTTASAAAHVERLAAGVSLQLDTEVGAGKRAIDHAVGLG